ncbi:MAG: hypothetical protein NVS2B16_07130 [Chloroflexota bacterium]
MSDANNAFDTPGARHPIMIPDVIVRPRAEDDDREIVSLSNQLNPEFPQITVDEYRAHISAFPPGVHCRRFVAQRKGELIGHGTVQEMFWVEHAGSSSIDIALHPAHWGKGIGSYLHDSLLTAARSVGVERLYARIRDDRPQGQRFAAAHGYKQTGHVEHLSRLDVHQVVLDGYDRLEERLQNEGIHVSTVAQLGPGNDKMLRAIHAVDMETAADVPSSEAFYLPFERWRNWLTDRPGVTPESIFVALERGEPIGLALLGRQGPDSAWHRGMGVKRAFRSRGVARLLKLRIVRWARDEGVDYLYTGNDAENPRMYSINMRLGYRPLPNVVEMVKDLNA